MIDWEKARLGRLPPAAVWAIRLGLAASAYGLGSARFASPAMQRPWSAFVDDGYLEVRIAVVGLVALRIVHLVVELITGLASRHMLTEVDLGRGFEVWQRVGPTRSWTLRAWPLGVRLDWAAPRGRRSTRQLAAAPLQVLLGAAVVALLMVGDGAFPLVDPEVVIGTVLAYLVGVFAPWPITPDAPVHSAQLLRAGTSQLDVDRAGWRHLRAVQVAISRGDNAGALQLLAAPPSAGLPPHTWAYLAAQTAPHASGALAILERQASRAIAAPGFADSYLTAVLGAAEAGQPATPLQLERCRAAIQVLAQTTERAVVAELVARFALHDGNPRGAIVWAERTLGWTHDGSARAHARMTLAVAYAQLGWRKQSAAALAKAERRHPSCDRWPGVRHHLAQAAAPTGNASVVGSPPANATGWPPASAASPLS